MKSTNDILEEREVLYGEYDQVAETSQDLKLVLRARTMDTMTPAMLESLDMICNKLARIVNGDPYYVDSWADIAGYAQLVVNELEADLFSKREVTNYERYFEDIVHVQNLYDMSRRHDHE